jgi:hypothetical protein
LTSGTRRSFAIAIAVVALSFASLWLTKLALAAGLFTLLGFLSLPKLEPGQKRAANGIYALAALASTIALVRFVLTVAVPALVLAGNETTAESAVSRLREVVFVEDAARERAFVDPDHDGVGSALWLTELSGKEPVRGKATLDPPLLNASYSHLEATKIGPAVLSTGYLFVVCLPTPGGGFSARPGDPVDEELAERRFLAYAWPAAAKPGLTEAFFADEHERILVSENREGNEPRYAGSSFPPPCDAALVEATREQWTPWRGKKPRSRLPGER